MLPSSVYDEGVRVPCSVGVYARVQLHSALSTNTPERRRGRNMASSLACRQSRLRETGVVCSFPLPSSSLLPFYSTERCTFSHSSSITILSSARLNSGVERRRPLKRRWNCCSRANHRRSERATSSIGPPALPSVVCLPPSTVGFRTFSLFSSAAAVSENDSALCSGAFSEWPLSAARLQ